MPRRIKCVVVGDNGVGKTTLLAVYTTGIYPETVSCVFDNYSQIIRVGDESYALELWDTYRPEEHNRLLPLVYPHTDVLLVCFFVVSPISFENIKGIWIDEIQHFCPGVPWLLIGTQSDLRTDGTREDRLRRRRMKPVTTKDANLMAQKLGAVKYIDCSALNDINVTDIFEQAIAAAVRPKSTARRKNRCILL